ncbi:Flavonol synthase/flavanone 3-hydroxylase [Apostasia shenzhenica]|uniref:Flavonol synthase/flavanone 3-hydroxylase n=1 Tax=Apostasia shenzhenica TaxID=1088818 RepID=A0A2I0B7C0_9ASPA|nr:Flavonol synthase/flavanone 3-hydroxylase [Apostasia shenzhenica]
MAALSSSDIHLLSDVSSQLTSVPSCYVRRASDQPDLTTVAALGASIPVIDLAGIDGPDRHKVVAAVGMACQTTGFFLVRNHGISQQVMANMLDVSREFFKLPPSDRPTTSSDDLSAAVRLSTSFNVATEEVRCWRDFLRLHCHPLEDVLPQWPSKPPSFRPVAAEYAAGVRKLAHLLLDAISESLGLERSFMAKALGPLQQPMVVNYYPRCPQPELTYGLPEHKDSSVVTLLLPDRVPGLQVRMRDGKWAAVDPAAGELVVNAGDMLEALSNGRYQSVLHRAMVNKESERMSISTFFLLPLEAVVEPPDKVVDDEHPRVFRAFRFVEYFEKFLSGGLRTQSCLDLFKN